MSYSVTIDEQGKTVILTLTGPADLQLHEESRRALIEACRESGYCKAIVDLREARMAGIVSEPESLQFAYGFTGRSFLSLPEPPIFAVLLPSNLKDRAVLRGMVRVSVNRGAEIQLFEEMDEAREWLQAAWAVRNGS
jgi:hypothetical protein